MKIKATYTIEKEYDCDLNEWLKYNPNSTEKEFQSWEENWIKEDFDRISNRAMNIIGNFDQQLVFTTCE